MNSELEQLIEDAHTSDEIGKSPSHSRRKLLLMLLVAPLASQAVAGCNGDSGGDGGGGTSSGGVTLSPQNPQVLAGSAVTFTVTPPTSATGTVQYDWTQTSAFATLSVPETTGNKLTTSSLTVKLITTPSDSAAITVTVTAFEVTPSGRTQVGSASTTVTVSTTVPANTMTLVGTDPDTPANNFNQTFPVSVGINDGAIAGTWAWTISDLGDPGDYPFALRITTPTLDQLAPPAGSSSLSVAYQAANTSPTWQLLNGNSGYGTGSPLLVTRTQNPSGGYTYNVSFSATNHTQTVNGTASFDVTSFPPK